MEILVSVIVNILSSIIYDLFKHPKVLEFLTSIGLKICSFIGDIFFFVIGML
jgi:hypothetical protein